MSRHFLPSMKFIQQTLCELRRGDITHLTFPSTFPYPRTRLDLRFRPSPRPHRGFRFSRSHRQNRPKNRSFPVLRVVPRLRRKPLRCSLCQIAIYLRFDKPDHEFFLRHVVALQIVLDFLKKFLRHLKCQRSHIAHVLILLNIKFRVQFVL